MKKAIIGVFVLIFVLCCVFAQPVTAHASENHEHPFCMATLNAEATCTESGEVCYTCAQCGESWSETIASGHRYESKVIREASCAKNGLMEYTCQECGDTYTETIVARGYHRVQSGKVTKEPTCTMDGVRTYICVDCGGTIEQAIPMTGHNFETIDPETGRGTCTVCGCTEFVHDHEWGPWTVTKIATYTEPGEHKRVCACGAEHVISLGCLEATPEEVYLEVLRLVNIERAKVGLAPLTYKYDAQIAVDARSQDLILEFDHYRPDGTKCYDVLDDYGIVHYGCMGENIAMGHQDAQEVMDGWMNSPGHRANILNPMYTSIAVGGVGYRWTQLFFG